MCIRDSLSSVGSIDDFRDVSTGGLRDVSPTGTWATPWPANSVAIDAATARRLCARATDSIQFVQPNENVARLRAVGRPEHARRVELVDDAGRATVTNLQPTLQQ